LTETSAVHGEAGVETELETPQCEDPNAEVSVRGNRRTLEERRDQWVDRRNRVMGLGTTRTLDRRGLKPSCEDVEDTHGDAQAFTKEEKDAEVG
jgi:hypothetical protein